MPSRQNRPDRPTAALEQIEATLAAGIPRGVVLAPLGYGAGYGADMKFRVLLAELGLEFIVGVQPRAKNLDQWQAAIAAQSLVGPNLVRRGPAALEPAP